MIINKAEYVISCVSKNQYQSFDKPEFVFLGRSNVGKSSFINALVGRKNLAYTSSKPGKTLTLNFFNVNDKLFFVDVPGYGYAARAIGKRIDFGNMIEEYLKCSHNLKKCFLIVDIRHDPTNDDILMYNYLRHFELDVIVIATKCDKISKNLITKHKKRVIDVLNIEDKNNCIIFSSETKVGVDDVHRIIESYL